MPKQFWIDSPAWTCMRYIIVCNKLSNKLILVLRLWRNPIQQVTRSVPDYLVPTSNITGLSRRGPDPTWFYCTKAWFYCSTKQMIKKKSLISQIFCPSFWFFLIICVRSTKQYLPFIGYSCSKFKSMSRQIGFLMSNFIELHCITKNT